MTAAIVHHPDCRHHHGHHGGGRRRDRRGRNWVASWWAGLAWGTKLTVGLAAAGCLALSMPTVADKTLPAPPAKKRVTVEAGWSREGTTDIPKAYRAHYVAAAKTCKQLTPWLLAGIGKVESNHGRSTAPGVRSGVNRHGCCAGPMQFSIIPAAPTWQGIARPGDNVYDPADAIPAAARKLCGDGLAPAPRNLLYRGQRDPCPDVGGSNASNRALRRYNNGCWYAAQVIAKAREYAPKGVRVA
jgi:hypothetical protein